MKKSCRRLGTILLSTAMIITSMFVGSSLVSAENNYVVTGNGSCDFSNVTKASDVLTRVAGGLDSENNPVTTVSDDYCSIATEEENTFLRLYAKDADSKGKFYKLSDMGSNGTLKSASFKMRLSTLTRDASYNAGLLLRWDAGSTNTLGLNNGSKYTRWLLKANYKLIENDNYHVNCCTVSGNKSAGGWGYFSGSNTTPTVADADIDLTQWFTMTYTVDFTTHSIVGTLTQGDYSYQYSNNRINNGTISDLTGTPIVAFMSPDNGSNTNSYVDIDDITYSYEKDMSADPEVTGFLSTYASQLALTTATVAVSNKADVTAALDAYSTLSVNAKTALSSEKSHLDSLSSKIAEIEAAALEAAQAESRLIDTFNRTGCVTPNLKNAFEAAAIFRSSNTTGGISVDENGLSINNGNYYTGSAFSVDGMPPIMVTGSFKIADPTANWSITFAASKDNAGIKLLYDTSANGYKWQRLKTGLTVGGGGTAPQAFDFASGVDFKMEYSYTGTNYRWAFSLKNSVDTDWVSIFNSLSINSYEIPTADSFGILSTAGSFTLGSISVDYGKVLPTMDGTSILKSGDTTEVQNMRFQSTLPEGRSDMKLIKYGITMMLDYYLNGQELTCDTVSSLPGRDSITAIEEESPVNTLGYSVSGNKYDVEVKGTAFAKYLAVPIAARAYCVYKDNSGNEYVVYSKNTDIKAIGNENVTIVNSGVSTSSVVRASRNIGKAIMANSHFSGLSETDNVTASSTKAEVSAILAKTNNTSTEEANSLLLFVTSNCSYLG